MSAAEQRVELPCFGTTCAVVVSGDTPDATAAEALQDARRSLLEWHGRFSRFIADSELSRLNADPRPTVPVSPLMARLAQAVAAAGELTGGLVDGTLLAEISGAGYTSDLGEPLPLARALALAPARRPAGPSPLARWRSVTAELPACTVTRPPGVGIDSGGLAKGLFADVLGEALRAHAAYVVDCGGDIAVGGAAAPPRTVAVASPLDGSTLHTFELRRGGVATSGIGRRSWMGADGLPAHHLLDPATGLPAFTGVVQATALAPTAFEAETRAKAAVLAGPRAAARWLSHGGVIVLDDGSTGVFDAPPAVSLAELSGPGGRLGGVAPAA